MKNKKIPTIGFSHTECSGYVTMTIGDKVNVKLTMTEFDELRTSSENFYQIMRGNYPI